MRDARPAVMLDATAVTVRFATHTVLDAVDLRVGDEEIVALLGPSGAGKTTLLRVIAGLLPPDGGHIVLAGDEVTSWPAHRRRVGMVFQDEQLFPHLDVAGNVAFGLRMAGLDRAAVATRVAEMLTLVDLPGYDRRSVGTLSGGEAKRVALARSLAPRPRLLLLDEPFTGLDRELHDRLVVEVGALLRQASIPAVIVTHDRDEATAIADRMVTLKKHVDD